MCTCATSLNHARSRVRISTNILQPVLHVHAHVHIAFGIPHVFFSLLRLVFELIVTFARTCLGCSPVGVHLCGCPNSCIGIDTIAACLYGRAPNPPSSMPILWHALLALSITGPLADHRSHWRQHWRQCLLSCYAHASTIHSNITIQQRTNKQHIQDTSVYYRARRRPTDEASLSSFVCPATCSVQILEDFGLLGCMCKGVGRIIVQCLRLARIGRCGYGILYLQGIQRTASG